MDEARRDDSGYGSAMPDSIPAAVQELRKLQIVTDAALAYMGVEDLLDELLVRVQAIFDVDTAAVLLLDESTNELVARAAKGLEEEVEQGVRIPLGHGFAGVVAADRRAVVIDEVDYKNVLNPILREKAVRSLLGVPLITAGRVIGVLHVGTLVPRKFTAADERLLQLVADRIALAIHVSLYERQRILVEDLQKSLLPESLPSILGIDFSARYLPAGGGDVGGDWYDAFVLPDGRVALVVGDVVGRGTHAASVMGRLRNAVRAYAWESRSAGETIDRLNAMFRSLDPGEMATMILGVLDAERRELSFANAGHLPLIVCGPNEGAVFVESKPHPPLGAVGPHTDVNTVQLLPGSTMILYTDGLVERRTTSLSARLETLRSMISSDVPIEELSDTLIAQLAEENGHDDVALLVVRLAADVTGPWRVSVEAAPANLAQLRSMLRAWLADLDVPKSTAFDILVATGEACTNAIEHAYGARSGEIELSLAKWDRHLEARVRDRGRWRAPRGVGRGRGVMMMRKLAKSVDIVRGDDGTEVRLGWTIADQ